MTVAIPFVDLVPQQEEVAAAVQPEIERILRSGSFIGGIDVDEFESAYADFVGVGHCVGVGNGTDGIEISLRATGVRHGDEVIIPANTFIATAEAVVRAGAVPVLVDVSPDTLLIDVDAVAERINSRTRAVIPVHLYGQMAPVEEVLDIVAGQDIAVIEDAAQSQGATRFGRSSGSIGQLASTSFYPGKNLGAAGDAGAVTTNDAELAGLARAIGNHGSVSKYVHDRLGFNSRLDSIQAVVLKHKLRRLPTWNAARRAAADRYAELLGGVADITLPVVASGNVHVWHLYVVRVQNRDEISARLKRLGVATGIHYPTAIHQTHAFRELGYREGELPVSEQAAAEIISLPMFPHITPGQQEQVAGALVNAIGW